METQFTEPQITVPEIMDTPRESAQESAGSPLISEHNPEELKFRLDDVIGSVSTDNEDDIHSITSTEEEQNIISFQESSTKYDLVQAAQAWTDTKDEVERRAGIKPCCPLCRTDLTLKLSVLLTEFAWRTRENVLIGRTASRVKYPSGKRKTLRGSSEILSRWWSRAGTLMMFTT